MLRGKPESVDLVRFTLPPTERRNAIAATLSTCRRAVGEDADGSARRKAGGGQRHVIGENARENGPFVRAGHDKQGGKTMRAAKGCADCVE